MAGGGSLVMAECEVYARGVSGLTGVNSVTLSEDGTRLYCTASSGTVAVFDRAPSGQLTFAHDIPVRVGSSDAAEVIVGGRRILYVLANGSPALQAFDVSPTNSLGTVTDYSAVLASLDFSSAFNADMVVNNGMGRIDSTQDGWFPTGAKDCYITQSAATQLGGANGNGLPNSGVLTLFGYPVRLGYSNANDGYNAIFLDDTATVPISLTQANQACYGSLYLIGDSGWGDAAVAVTILYSDGSSATVPVTVEDWWADDAELATGVVTLINGMDWHQSGVWQNVNDPAVFAFPVPVDSAKVLVEIDLAWGSGGPACIFGAAGQIAALPMDDLGLGALRAIEAISDPGIAPEVYVLGQDALGVHETCPDAYSLATLVTVPCSGSGPASLHVTQDRVYVADAGADAVRVFAGDRLDVGSAESWTTTVATLLNRGSPAPVTSVIDIPGGVKLTYNALSGGTDVGTSTFRYDFTTTATATGRLTLDITFHGFHGWYQPVFSLTLFRNAEVVSSFSGASPDWYDDVFNNISFDISQGDTYRIRVMGGNFDAAFGMWGEVIVVHEDFLGPETTTTAQDVQFPLPLDLPGLQSVTVSPDGRFVYAVDPERGALVVLDVVNEPGTENDGSLSFVEACTDESYAGSSLVDGLAGASQVALNPVYNQLYVLSPDEPAIAVFDRDPVLGTLTFRQRVGVGAGVTGLVVSPEGQKVYTTGPNGLSIWTRQPDGLLAVTPDLHVIPDAGDWVIQAVHQSAERYCQMLWMRVLAP